MATVRHLKYMFFLAYTRRILCHIHIIYINMYTLSFKANNSEEHELCCFFSFFSFCLNESKTWQKYFLLNLFMSIQFILIFLFVFFELFCCCLQFVCSVKHHWYLQLIVSEIVKREQKSNPFQEIRSEMLNNCLIKFT